MRGSALSLFYKEAISGNEDLTVLNNNQLSCSSLTQSKT